MLQYEVSDTTDPLEYTESDDAGVSGDDRGTDAKEACKEEKFLGPKSCAAGSPDEEKKPWTKLDPVNATIRVAGPWIYIYIYICQYDPT